MTSSELFAEIGIALKLFASHYPGEKVGAIRISKQNYLTFSASAAYAVTGGRINGIDVEPEQYFSDDRIEVLSPCRMFYSSRFVPSPAPRYHTFDQLFAMLSANHLSREEAIMETGSLHISPPACECGAEKCGSNLHSSWCAKNVQT